ncbi:MAG: response regulator [Eubacteriales bacterium]|nr:response regulator [Eubacteriales bacterium]
MKLMILNDEKISAETLKEELEWERYGIDEVRLAFNVEQARNVFREHAIDIALCDIEMPGENGIDFLRWMREENYDAECIFLTCHASFSYAQEAVKLGCQDYILIPARHEDIGNAVQKVAQRRRENQEMQKLGEYGKQWLDSKKEELLEKQGSRLSPGEIVEESVRFIREHLESDQLSVNEVANHCHLNPIYLNRIFKKEKGTSISQFIIREKMELAARLLKDSGLTAQNVAEQVGYPNYPHFSTTFKKYYGCAPAQYKERAEKV